MHLFLISAQYSIYTTKVHSFETQLFFKLNSTTVQLVCCKRYMRMTLPTSLFKAQSICRQCFHLRNCQLTSVCQMYALRLEMIRHLKVHMDVCLNKKFITTWDRLTGLCLQQQN